jgi:hypothetical protein
MFNECSTKIVVTGSEKELARFKKECLRDDLFSFEKVVSALPDDEVLATLREIDVDEDLFEWLREAAEVIDWCNERWGCPLDVHVGRRPDVKPEMIEFSFGNFGGPAEKVFEAMAIQYPRLAFKIVTEKLDCNDVGPVRRRTAWKLGNGKVISVHRSADMDAVILERIRPGMSEEEKGRLADWCAGQDQANLLTAEEWFDQVRRLCRESARRSADNGTRHSRTKSTPGQDAGMGPVLVWRGPTGTGVLPDPPLSIRHHLPDVSVD